MCKGVTIIGSMNDVYLGSSKGVYAYIAKLKKLGCLVKDEPDLMLRWPIGRVLYVELKKAGEKPTKEQFERMAEIAMQGFAIDWCSSIEDFINVLKFHRVPMRKGTFSGSRGIIQL